jgi:UDP-2,4-diacetamido-2,4,6-trideoxy-beta-L-altropyranose hydrolase
MSEILLIRADAGPQIGLGHVMRCLAIAEAWHGTGGQVAFVSHQPPRELQDRMEKLGSACHPAGAVPGSDEDAAECAGLAHELGARWAVVDGYHFGERYQRQLKEAGLRLLAIDDHGHAGHYWADLVLNQTAGIDPALYADREPCTRLLLGARYVLLRRDYLKWRDWQRPMLRTARRLLLTLGGSDAENATQRIMAALPARNELPLETTVVIGPGNPHRAAIEPAARARAGLRVVCAPPQMPELMAQADVGITAGGITAWEMAFMALPQLTVVLAENQRGNAAQIESQGVGRSLGWHQELTGDRLRRQLTDLCQDFEARARMSHQGRLLVDGQGAARVCFHLSEHRLSLRRAQPEDCRKLWEWANDPEARAASFSAAPIPWTEHVQWFERKLAARDSHLFVSTDPSGALVGVARFDVIEAKTAVISITLDCRWRGKGLGSLLIWMACRKLFSEGAVERVQAWIKPENRASLAAFERAGFEPLGIELEQGQSACKYLLTRPTDAP